MKKKSLVAKYEKVAEAGGTAIEVKNAIMQGEPILTLDEVDEIVMAIFDKEATQEEQDNDPPPQSSPALPVVEDKLSTIRGKKLYDIYRGKWEARKKVTGLDGNDMVIEWEFMPEGKPMKTGVPMEPEKAEHFNVTKQLCAGGVFTEQMRESGSTARILHILPNPYSIQEIRS